MEPTNFRRIMSLDIATATAIQDDRNGLADSTRVLRHGDVENPMYDMLTQVPDHYHVMDVRKPAGKYVNDKMLLLIDELFEIRGELEKNMNRRELASFDKVFAITCKKNSLCLVSPYLSTRITTWQMWAVPRLQTTNTPKTSTGTSNWWNRRISNVSSIGRSKMRIPYSKYWLSMLLESQHW